MRTIYISDDGAKFDRKEACIEHEERIKGEGINILILDRANKPTKNLEDAFAIDVKDEDALKWLDYISGYLEFLTDGIDEVGKYYYASESGCWVEIDTRISVLKHYIEDLEDIKKRLESEEE